MSGSAWNDDVDRIHLERAREIAEHGRYLARPNPMVGAVLATPTQQLAEGWHARYGEAHAERACLDAWGGADIPTGATLYVTLEPCSHQGKQPPCSKLILGSGIQRVVIGCADPNRVTHGIGPAELADAGIDVVWAPAQLAASCARVNAGFHSVHTRARPHVHAKWAMTSNGRFATGDPAHRWITGAAARRQVHDMRARCGAVVVGVGTVLADDPHLTARDIDLPPGFAQPLRVVLDRDLRTPADSRLARSVDQGPVLVVTTRPVDPTDALSASGVEIWRAPTTDMLLSTLEELARRSVNDVLLEAGPTLLSAFEQANLIDQISCYVAPFEAPDEQPGLDLDHPLVRRARAFAPVAVGDDLLYAGDTAPHPR